METLNFQDIILSFVLDLCANFCNSLYVFYNVAPQGICLICCECFPVIKVCKHNCVVRGLSLVSVNAYFNAFKTWHESQEGLIFFLDVFSEFFGSLDILWLELPHYTISYHICLVFSVHNRRLI